MKTISEASLKTKYTELGLSISYLAVEFECSHQTISRRLNQFGIEKRPPKYHNMIGKEFGKWTVIGKTSRGRCKARCECGKVKMVQAHALVNGSSTQCKRCAYNSNNYKEITGRFWRQLLNNASVRNLAVSITKEGAWNLFIQQERKCALSGLPIRFGPDTTASIDRIDSTKGYDLANIQWAHKIINKMKCRLTDDDFISYCKAVAAHRAKKEPRRGEILAGADHGAGTAPYQSSPISRDP